jgi:hypothetical protein
MGSRHARRWIGLALVAAALATAGFLAGRGADVTSPDPIQTHGGVPVGVEHSRGGAVAAADSYLATEQAAVERDPATFAALVSADYAKGLRAGALAAAEQDRRLDPRGMALWASGGRSFTVIGAHRLDWYRGEEAQVTAWAAQIFWGAGEPPAQAWSLARITLQWSDGRWRVTVMSTLPAAIPAPASLPQAAPSDDSASTFARELAGFSPVSYGSPG